MKKLLNILTITTLTASVPAPLLANTVQTRAKRDVSMLTSNSNNNYLPLKENIFIPKDILYFTVSGKGNIYYLNVDLFVLKHGETTPAKIHGINYKINDFVVATDKKDRIYFGTTNGIYVLNDGTDTATKINVISGYLTSIAVDSKDNIYFMSADGAFVLKQGETTPTKINVISGYLTSIAVDSKDNVYFGTKDGAYVLKQGTTTVTKANGITKKFIIDSKDNVYFGTKDGAYKLSAGSDTAKKIVGINGFKNIDIDSKDNVYFGTSEGLYKLSAGSTTPAKINDIDNFKYLIVDKYNNNIYFKKDSGIYFTTTVLDWIKQQSQFALVDGTKTQTWTRPDLLSVDGEVNIEITNPNIDKVVFDNIPQGQTNKHWTINVKPETSEKDHNLQVMFTLDGKQYTSEIMVSMQAKIESPKPPTTKQLSELITNTDLGNILDNNDDTIFTAVNQKNSNVIDDFSQIEITKNDNHSATLTAKPDSKSYTGSVDVKYNVVPATTVDLKIDVTPISSTATVIKDYLGQINDSNITNPVNTFYYANSESVITLIKPTASSVITGVVYGCDDNWNKTSISNKIDSANGIKLDGSQLATTNGKYVVELLDNLGHTNNVYLQINEDKKDIKEYWNTDNGKNFEQWADDNGYKNIRGYSASQLNNLLAVSKTWKQSLAHLDLKLDNFVVENIKNVTQDEIDNYKTKLLASVKAQVEKYVPNVVENVDYKIMVDNLVVGDWTASKDVKVQSVNGSTKLLSFATKTIPVQQKEQPTPDNNKKTGLGIWAIFGIVVGSLLGLALLGWLFKRFVVEPFILKPIREKKEKAFAAKTEKDIAQMKKDDEEWEAKQKGDK